MNYFIEGLQGSGKSTLTAQLSEKHKDHTAFREGDYSPVELAWCAWMTDEAYEKALEKYSSIRDEIIAKTVTEGSHKVMRYTQIHTDISGFYKDMEQYEIYNGRIGSDEFSRIVLSRFRAWNGSEQIFECSLFQNIIEDMMLFRVMSDDEIISFYSEIREALEGREYRILYLRSDDIEQNIAQIRRERSDGNGNELWFPVMIDYFDNCPYSKAHNKSGGKDLIGHLSHRQELELRLCREIFADKAVILKSKAYDLSSID